MPYLAIGMDLESDLNTKALLNTADNFSTSLKISLDFRTLIYQIIAFALTITKIL